MTTPRLERRNYGRGHGYKIDGNKVIGVTTALKVIAKPALIDWAANTTAEAAVDRWDELTELTPTQRLKELKESRWIVNRAAILRGNEIHDLGEKLSHGEPIDVPPEHLGPVEAYARFLDRWQLEFVGTEAPCANLDIGYAGTLDAVASTPLLNDGQPIVLDIKGLSLDTPLPTPTGWTTMGQVAVGDQVIGSDGHPCTVRIKSQVKRIGTYVVHFDDGSRIVCDREHIWWTAPGLRAGGAPEPRPIQEVIETLHLRGQAHHRIPNALPLQLPDADLPIDPYVLGCWLGDGAKGRAVITKGRDLFTILNDDGVPLGVEQVDKRTGIVTRTVLGLAEQLRAANLLYNKHVPDQYLRASQHQRLRLLQGLMDTDGTWNTARNRAAFTTTTKGLALAVEELLCTLGQRPHLSSVQRSGFGVTVTAYDVEWRPVRMRPFRLPRKADKVRGMKSSVRAAQRIITAVTEGPDVDTACIGVDSPNHTYLCGHRMIPTHNTGKGIFSETALQLAAYARCTIWQPDGPASETAMPEVAGLYVAHVLADDVRMVPILDDTDKLFLRFRYALALARWDAEVKEDNPIGAAL